MQLHTIDGARKYLTTGERDRFLRAAEQADRQVQTLCMTLAYAGCRLSEALALTVDRVDLAAGVLVIESLKSHGRPTRVGGFQPSASRFRWQPNVSLEASRRRAASHLKREHHLSSPRRCPWRSPSA